MYGMNLTGDVCGHDHIIGRRLVLGHLGFEFAAGDLDAARASCHPNLGEEILFADAVEYQNGLFGRIQLFLVMNQHKA